MIGPGLDTEAIQGIIPEIDIIETKAGAEIGDKGPGLSQEIGKIDPDQVSMLALREIGPGAIDTMNMIILPGNALMLCLMKDLIKKMI